MIVLGSIVAIGGVIFVAFPYVEKARINLIEESARNQIEKTKAVKSSESVESVDLEPEPKKEQPIVHPGRDGYTPYKMGEEEFIQDVHDMTHQKVYAKDKWGALEANSDNISTLLSLLDETDFEEEEYFRAVLTTWKAGDFSNAALVHNKIWNDQDGYNGMAERLLTSEEEQEFIEINFR